MASAYAVKGSSESRKNSPLLHRVVTGCDLTTKSVTLHVGFVVTLAKLWYSLAQETPVTSMHANIQSLQY